MLSERRYPKAVKIIRERAIEQNRTCSAMAARLIEYAAASYQPNTDVASDNIIAGARETGEGKEGIISNESDR